MGESILISSDNKQNGKQIPSVVERNDQINAEGSKTNLHNEVFSLWDKSSNINRGSANNGFNRLLALNEPEQIDGGSAKKGEGTEKTSPKTQENDSVKIRLDDKGQIQLVVPSLEAWNKGASAYSFARDDKGTIIAVGERNKNFNGQINYIRLPQKEESSPVQFKRTGEGKPETIMDGERSVDKEGNFYCQEKVGPNQLQVTHVFHPDGTDERQRILDIGKGYSAVSNYDNNGLPVKSVVMRTVTDGDDQAKQVPVKEYTQNTNGTEITEIDFEEKNKTIWTWQDKDKIWTGKSISLNDGGASSIELPARKGLKFTDGGAMNYEDLRGNKHIEFSDKSQLEVFSDRAGYVIKDPENRTLRRGLDAQTYIDYKHSSTTEGASVLSMTRVKQEKTATGTKLESKEIWHAKDDKSLGFVNEFGDLAYKTDKDHFEIIQPNDNVIKYATQAGFGDLHLQEVNLPGGGNQRKFISGENKDPQLPQTIIDRHIDEKGQLVVRKMQSLTDGARGAKSPLNIYRLTEETFAKANTDTGYADTPIAPAKDLGKFTDLKIASDGSYQATCVEGSGPQGPQKQDRLYFDFENFKKTGYTSLAPHLQQRATAAALDFRKAFDENEFSRDAYRKLIEEGKITPAIKADFQGQYLEKLVTDVKIPFDKSRFASDPKYRAYYYELATALSQKSGENSPGRSKESSVKQSPDFPVAFQQLQLNLANSYSDFSLVNTSIASVRRESALAAMRSTTTPPTTTKPPERAVVRTNTAVTDAMSARLRQLNEQQNKPVDKLEHKPVTKHPRTVEQAKAMMKEAKEAGLPVVLHIGASWCGPCQSMQNNVYPALMRDAKHPAMYLQIDSDQVPNYAAIARSLGCNNIGSSVPYVAVFNSNGNKSYGQAGALSLGELRAKIKSAGN